MTADNGPSRDELAVEFISRYIATRGFAPTIREVGQAVGLNSSSTAAALIDRLVTAGAVRHTRGIPRSLVVVEAVAS